MPEEVQQLAPQPQVTTAPKATNWKKVILTIVFIVAVVVVVTGVYWFLVLSKTSDNSDLTGPVPKVTTKISTESAKEATSSAEKDETADWETYTNKDMGIYVKYPRELTITDPTEEFGQISVKLRPTGSSKGKSEIKITSEKGGLNLKDTYDAASKLEVNKQSARSIGVLETRSSDLRVDNVKAIVVQVDAGESEESFTKIFEVHIKRGDNYYLFSSKAYNEKDLGSSFETLKSILESVELLG